MPFRVISALSAALLLIASLAPSAGAQADERFFSQTNFRIDDNSFWDFFQHRGGVRTFGYPVSRTFMLDGFPVQIFQREVMQRQADGSVLTRWTGPAFVYAAGASTTDEVVFGEPGDLVLLGSRSLEGLNLVIDPIAKRLSDAGPMPLACLRP